MSSRVSSADCKRLRILLVSEDPVDSRWLKQLLAPVRGGSNGRSEIFNVSRADRLSQALESLARHHFQVAVVDLGLASADALTPVSEILSAAPDMPVVVLSGFKNDGLALEAIRRGAQDCLFKDSLDGESLKRTIRHAVERKRNESKSAGEAGELAAAHKQLEQQAAELRSCRKQLDEISHELEDFTYIASHDLKEPLRGISSYCEILLEDYRHRLDADGKRRLNTVLQLCDRLENLIDDLLNYCRVGRKAQKKTRVNLNAVVANHLKMLRPVIERHNAHVQVSGPLPPIVGNATLIGTAIVNLIANGLKFNVTPRPHVELGWLPTKPVTFYIKDNGIGIAREHHEAIFTIFRRLHSRKKYEGSGVGLTIVRKIVELHGGRIWLDSAPGAGTTFYFTLEPSVKSGSIQGDAPEHALSPPHWTRRNQASRLSGRLRSKSSAH
jgi:signal transduction histidine kinase